MPAFHGIAARPFLEGAFPLPLLKEARGKASRFLLRSGEAVLAYYRPSLNGEERETAF